MHEVRTPTSVLFKQALKDWEIKIPVEFISEKSGFFFTVFFTRGL